MKFPVDVPEWAGRKLKEASELTGETEDNLLRLAIKGDLPLWVWFPYPGADPVKDILFNKVKMMPYHGWAKIEPAAILRFINGEAISSFELRVFDQKKGILNCAAFYYPEVNATTNKFHLSQIRVMPADLERLTTPGLSKTPPESKEGRDKRESALVLGLLELEQDKDILAAVLYDEHDVPYWRVWKLLDIGNPDTKPESREKAASRAAERGRKKIASRGQK